MFIVISVFLLSNYPDDVLAQTLKPVSDNINISGKEIKVTSPKGYAPIKEKFPNIFTTFEQMTPPTNALKEAYLPITFIEALSSGKEMFYEEYALIQSWKEGEQYDMTQVMFAQIKQNYYKQFGILSAENIATYDSVLNKAENHLKYSYEDMDITVQQVVPLGIYADTDNYISFMQLIKYEMTQGNEKIVYCMLSSVTQMLLKGKTLNFYVFRKYKKREDIDYVKKFSERWAKNINILNEVSQPTQEKQYANEKYGISFNYPADWIVNKLKGDYIFKITKGIGSRRKAFIVSATTESYESPDKFYEELLSEVNAESKPLVMKAVGLEVVDSGSTEVGGNPAVYLLGHQKMLNMRAVQKNIFVLRNNTLFNCTIRASGKSIQEAELRQKDMESVVDEILASLVFSPLKLDYPASNITEKQIVDASFYMMLIISVVFTWGFGLLVPVLVRYVFAKKPIRKPIAITIAVIWFFVLLIIAILLQSTSKTHAVLFLVSFVGYLIMHRGYKVLRICTKSEKKI